MIASVGAFRFRPDDWIKNLFEDVYKVSKKLREIGLVMMEELDSVKQLSVFLMESVQWMTCIVN